jgi:hypothetical protein
VPACAVVTFDEKFLMEGNALVAVATGVLVGNGVKVLLGVGVSVNVDVAVGRGVRVIVAVLVGVNVLVGVCVTVAVAVLVAVLVGVAVSVWVAVKVALGVKVAVWVGRSISVGNGASSVGAHAANTPNTSTIQIGNCFIASFPSKLAADKSSQVSHDSMRIILKIALIALVPCACTPTSETMPTLVELPTQSAGSFVATLPPVTPLLGLLPTEPITLLPTQTPIPPTPTRQVVNLITLPPPTQPPTPTATNTVAPTRTPLPAEFTFGSSVQGRPLYAYRFGTGQHVIVLVGGVHAGFERNTTALMNRIREHLAVSALEILPDITFVIVPLLNPDGETQGETLEGRFNANGVDLNRNWGCGWQAEARFRDMTVSGGTQAFSEPESLALGGLIQQLQPRVVLFYHSAANGVFGGHCNTVSVSEELAQVYGEAAQYPYSEPFSAYPVTGTAPNWVDSLGIPSADIELATSSDTEFIRNWNALLAVQGWVVGE